MTQTYGKPVGKRGLGDISVLKIDSVSIVIPCFNPGPYLQEAVESARRQTHEHVEVVLVDDGTCESAALAILDQAGKTADRFIRQPHRGLPAARNAGFQAAGAGYVVPLNCDDKLDPDYVSDCLRALRGAPEAAFVYTDNRAIGKSQCRERVADYNLYDLLDRNSLPYAALIRKNDWAAVGGYDESLTLGYEDWEFWLRLGAAGRFGLHLDKVLFNCRKHGQSLPDTARLHHLEIVSAIQAKHRELFAPEGRARLKAEWAPAAIVVGTLRNKQQSILDWKEADFAEAAELARRRTAPAFLIPAEGGVDAHSAELAALAVWGGGDRLRLPDGSLALSGRGLSAALRGGAVSIDETIPSAPGRVQAPSSRRTGRLAVIHRHLVNAGLLSPGEWLRHPIALALRLVPSRVKERLNELAGRPIFDLSFYQRFRPPDPTAISQQAITPLKYIPAFGTGRRRVGFILPHLGPGGAESVLLEVAGTLCRETYEIILVATQSDQSAWLPRWLEHVDHIYDLAPLLPPERIAGAVYSIVSNWKLEVVVIQNSLAAYAMAPHLKRNSPEVKIVDFLHSFDEDWSWASVTREIAKFIDLRVAISEEGRAYLVRDCLEKSRVRLIRHGVDLDRFPFMPPRTNAGRKQVLFAARLDPVKRPALLPEIALKLLSRRGTGDFVIAVAGTGPEIGDLRARANELGVGSLIAVLGHVDDMPVLIGESDVVILTSEKEGIPLILMEAMAMGRPVVSSNAGQVRELVDPSSGFLIDIDGQETDRFAEVLDKLFDDAALRAAMGEAGRRCVEREWDLRRSRDEYRSLFV